LESTLQQAGYSVVQAKEGAEALRKLQQISVDAIFCDLEMPGMNGLDFLTVCQQTPQIADIPIIILSSRSSKKHQQLAKQLGATDYLTKPYLAPQLLDKLANALKSTDSQRQEAGDRNYV
jgi:chemotaxis family two-component system sensor histidine kinase/response regulator PixL